MNVLLRDASELLYTGEDLIITDPPYNIGYKYNGEFHDRMTEEEYGSLFEPMQEHRVVMIHYVQAIYEEIAPCLGYPEEVVSWTYPSNAGSKCWRAIAWFNCRPDWTRYRVPYANPNDKRIKELVKKTGGRSLSNHWHVNLVKNVSREKVKEYTNQIPEEIVRRIISTTAQKGDIIVDPFSGTGTTAAVAQQMGYDFRAYDINPLAVELTERRLQSWTSAKQNELPFDNGAKL
jgi:DNA modification methylase